MKRKVRLPCEKDKIYVCVILGPESVHKGLMPQCKTAGAIGHSVPDLVAREEHYVTERKGVRFHPADRVAGW